MPTRVSGPRLVPHVAPQQGTADYNQTASAPAATASASSPVPAIQVRLMPGVTDDANRPDQGPPPSVNWEVNPQGFVESNFTVTGNQFAPIAAVDNEMAWLADTFGPTIDFSFDVPTLPASTQTVDLEVLTVWTNPNQTGYDLQYVRDGGFNLYRADNGTYSQIGTFAQELSPGDATRIRVTATAVEGWARLSGTWTRLISVADTTYRSAGIKIGVYVNSNTVRLDNFVATTATNNASAPTPTIQIQVAAPAATASASSPVPIPQLRVAPAVATATASSPAPVMPITVPVTTASANSPPATPQLQVAAPAATASASAPLPALKLQVAPAAATATASAPAPVMPIVAPVATASASAPTPTLQDRVSPGADTATGSAPTPGVDVKLSPAAATASASAPVPVVSAGTTLFPPVATASASASSLTDWTPTTGAWLLSNVNLTGSDADWATREAALGRTFSGRMKYKTITTTSLSDLNVGDLFASVAYPTAGGLSFSGNNTIPSINAGSQDANLIAFANAVKAIAPTRVFLRLFWEFNLAGNRFNPANYVDSGGGAAPGAWADFQSAWVRVWTIFFGTAGDFTAQGISGTPPACSHDQVKFAYNPNKKGGSSPVDPTLGYPGSQYVDWVFLDSYPNRVSGANEVLDSPTILVTKPSVSGAVDWYNTFASYGKPLGIGETSVHPVDDSTTIYGSGNGVSPVTRSQWWSLWVPALQAFPLIRLVTFFDANDATWPGSGHTWQTDAASATTGDSGSQAFTAYSTFANDAYVKPLGSAGLGVTVPPAAATASASAPIPTVTAVTANQTVSAPAATATASAPTPTPALKVPPAAGTASASAPTPTISVALTVFAPVATASAASPAPTLALRLSPPAATAAASAIGPADIDAIPAPAATASASAPAPTLSIPIGGIVSVPVIFAVASAPTPKIHHIFFDIAELWHHHENGLGEFPIAPGLSLNTSELFNQRYRDNSKPFPVTGNPSLTVDLEKLWDQKYRDTSVPFPVDQL